MDRNLSMTLGSNHHVVWGAEEVLLVAHGATTLYVAETRHVGLVGSFVETMGWDDADYRVFLVNRGTSARRSWQQGHYVPHQFAVHHDGSALSPITWRYMGVTPVLR